ncbi:hypothetical protein ILUMI_02385 [Ignelater luminosus]|uniref:Transposable element P transposase n=1 Tax=Ignelater luminosus TaxID=2038154 RepID=A0A8K0GKV5_IGNLU|nr:hypothetical protein ILUMI_02385 [Ignelater luminosus]
MDEKDRNCTLMFDEMSLNSGFYYLKDKQKIVGYEDLGHLGRTEKGANHALVFMVRGIRKFWKQTIAYYFTAHSISTISLKNIIVEIISNLQQIGLKVVATVCDQGTTNRAALSQLCAENKDRPSSYYFVVNENKAADLSHLKTVFELDQQRKFKLLPRLRQEYFNPADSYIKMKVKVAAQLLSHTAAAAIDTYTSVTSFLPSEAIFTAEFIELIDSLFDSLNSSHTNNLDGKKYRCVVTESSPHVELWSNLLVQIRNWKLFDKATGKERTNQYAFLDGWQTSIKSILYLWNTLKNDGFRFLCTRSLNQDPIENLFCNIRQHGIANTNPTCHQFTAALKTVVINNLAKPKNTSGNCEDDDCAQLINLSKFITVNNNEESENIVSECHDKFSDFTEVDVPIEESQALAYVSGYVLKKINISDCNTCQENLLAESVTPTHVYTSFKEYTDEQCLQYAADNIREEPVARQVRSSVGTSKKKRV